MFGALPPRRDHGARSRPMLPMPTFSIGRFTTTTRLTPANNIGIASSPAMPRAIRSRRTWSAQYRRFATLVDECRDLSLDAATTGEVSPSSENARTVQEDCHRLAMNPGSSMIYRVKEPINQCRVYSFAPAEANLALASRRTEELSTPSAVDRSAFPVKSNSLRLCDTDSFAGELSDRDAKYLRIENSGNLTGREHSSNRSNSAALKSNTAAGQNQLRATPEHSEKAGPT